MSSIESLAELFQKFPGIGPRQAYRFVYYLLRQNPSYRKELIRNIEALGLNTHQCDSCFRFFEGTGNTCNICKDKTRDDSSLLIVEKDTDLDAIERSYTYKGRYAILGGTRMLANDRAPLYESRVISHVKELSKKGTLKEIIFALSATPDGEYTTSKLRESLRTIVDENKVTFTTLGRGLSTGSELEYADPETLKNALTNRK